MWAYVPGERQNPHWRMGILSSYPAPDTENSFHSEVVLDDMALGVGSCPAVILISVRGGLMG